MSDQECGNCGGTGYISVDRDGISAASRCPCYLDRMAASRVPKAGIPGKFARSTFDNFEIGGVANPVVGALRSKVRIAVKRFAVDFPSGAKKSLLLTGPPGAGKTHLAIAAFRTILEKGFDGVFFEYQQLLNLITASWNPASGVQERAAYGQALETPLLFLDDLGARRSSEWVEDTITSIITDRYNNERPLIATSNLRLDYGMSSGSTAGGSPRFEKTLAEVIGARSASRLAEMCVVVDFQGLPDYRQPEQGFSSQVR
ncbi:MAG TPA: ATP-binding protein [Bryobacteraceae bacterium]|nr:ATP-binding protein [Bryobacteraceae bacterium]